MWVPVPFDPSEVREPYKFDGHSFKPLKGFVKPVCTGCGLLAATNALTEWAVAKGCDWKNHPQFKSARRKLCNALQ